MVSRLDRRLGEEAFLAHDTLTVPPAASLRELEIVAYEITAKRIDDLKALRQWLKVLVAPGASLGGARPKASFTETNGSLWIAKFPARDDTRDVGAWESLVQQLGARAGIDVPASELRRFSGEYHTFCVQRFDRSGARRRFYASAMALLRKDQSEGASYLELAEFLHTRGAKDYIEADLEQLFRRVAFNVAIGNRDDHLRNQISPNQGLLARGSQEVLLGFRDRIGQGDQGASDPSASALWPSGAG